MSLSETLEQIEKAAEFCDEDGRFIPAKLAEWIMRKYTFATMMDNEETYTFTWMVSTSPWVTL